MKRRNNLKKMALVAAFALAGAGAWAQSSAKAIPVTEYDATVFDKEDTLTRKEIRRISARIVFLGSSYRLEVTKAKGDYTGYALGFKTTGDWMTYVPAQATATVERYPAAPAALKTVLNAANVAPSDGEKSWKLDKTYSVPTDGYLAATVSSASVTLLGSGTATFNTMATATVSIPLPGSEVAFGETTFVVLMKHSGGVDAIVIKRVNEYWNGEYALFSNILNGEYKKMALGLLAKQFGTEGSTTAKVAFSEKIPPYFGLAASAVETDWSYIKTPAAGIVNSDAEVARGVKAISSALANGLMQAVVWEDGKYPVIDTNQLGESYSDSFDMLYGNSRNIYLRAYFAATNELGVPPLYGLLAAKGEAFDLVQYKTVSVEKSTPPEEELADQGEELAEAAMRYVTWGVEYTPPERSYDAKRPALRWFAHVYESNQDIIDTWIGSSSSSGSQKDDYLKSGKTPLSGISAEANFTGTAVELPAFMIDGKVWYSGYYSPFTGGAYGLPIPYAAGGIDTPRTFAYKLVQQLAARNAIHETAMTVLTGVELASPGHMAKPFYKDPSFGNYVKTSELLQWGATVVGDAYSFTNGLSQKKYVLKPFLPGGATPDPLNSGIDTWGFVTACIAMTDFSAQVKGYGSTAKSTVLAESYIQPCVPSAIQAPTVSRFNLADLERMSVIVPDLSGLQNGDILVKKGSAGIADEVGIVVYVPAITTAMKADWSLLQKEVVVVTVRAAFRQATLGTWGNRGSTFGGFTTDPNGFVVRRLLVDTGKAQTELKSAAIDPVWNLTSPVVDPAASSFRIASMYEHTRVVPEGEDRSSLRERWIPNTGEYLRFDAYVTMRNASGAAMDPTVFFPDSVKVVLGAIDRNYDDVSAADSNITKNQGAGFSLAGGFDNWTSFETDIDTLARTTAGNEAEKRIYTNTGGGAFWLASSGHVVAKKDEAIGITCIRPLPATSATDWIHPGDDILLTVSLSTDTGIQITDAPIVSLEPDYLAVYDKKMLWRANLYISEPLAGSPGSTDWNDLHPWNAPPVSGVAADGGNPSWWSENWGYNEWNRKYEGTSVFNLISNLDAGEGKQVVTMPTTRWWENANAGLNQINDKKLAYDYWGWDNPFSFTKKIFEQKLILNQWYTAQGLRFQKSVSDWRLGDPDSWTMTEGEKKTLLKSYLPDTTDYQASSINLATLRSSFLSFRDTPSNRWNNTQSPAETTNPMRHTRNYARGPDYDKYDTWFNGVLLNGVFELDSISETFENIELHPYVPGLSNELHYGKETNGTQYLQQFAAGADCIGFIQGALSYIGVSYQAMLNDSRKVVPSYWANIGTKAANSAMTDLNSAQSIQIATKEIVVDNNITTNLNSMVPGDIFYYFNNGHHIACVASIDPILFYSDLLSDKLMAIKIIESTHNRSLDLFGVGTTTTLYDYSYNETARPWQLRRIK